MKAAPLLLLLLAGCFTARSGAEGYHARVRPGMDREAVRKAVGRPRETFPIPGQGGNPELPVEQNSYWWSYKTGKALTVIFTLGIGLIWTDWEEYGFAVGFGADGRVRSVSEVAPRRP